MTNSDCSLVPVDALQRGEVAHSDDASRRRFLEIMGASLAMAAAAGCTRQPTEFIVPYVEPPEDAIPGRPSYYATARLVQGIAQGVVVESHLGRPTKVEGNPGHPASLGATDVHGQSCVLDLYDPDRSKQVTESGEPREWDAFLLALGKALEPLGKTGGEGLYMLSEPSTSPTLGAQRSAVMKAFPNARWHQYDASGPDNARAGASLCFGRPVNTYYRLDRADVLVALDSDFLASGPACTRYAHDYAMRRRVRGADASMNRLYSVECEMTSTGGKAEHRLALRYREIEIFARDLAAALNAGGTAQSGAAHAEWISALARDLIAHRGASAIIPGDAQPPAVHALAHSMNALLGNVGTTVVYTDPIEIASDDSAASLRDLAGAADAGKIQVLLMLGGNPVYTAPADLDFAGRLNKVPAAIHVSLHPNETSACARWLVPERHFLEGWSDARAFDGTVTILQPLIEPLYRGWSYLEVLDALVRRPARSAYDIVRSYWEATANASEFETSRQSVCLRSGRIEYPVTAGYRVILCSRARPQLKPFLHSCVCRLQSMVPGRQLNIGEALVALP